MDPLVNSIISITDEETLGDTIDLTDEVTIDLTDEDTIDLTDDLELSGANLRDTSGLSRLDNPMIVERRLR